MSVSITEWLLTAAAWEMRTQLKNQVLHFSSIKLQELSRSKLSVLKRKYF